MHTWIDYLVYIGGTSTAVKVVLFYSLFHVTSEIHVDVHLNYLEYKFSFLIVFNHPHQLNTEVIAVGGCEISVKNNGEPLFTPTTEISVVNVLHSSPTAATAAAIK